MGNRTAKFISALVGSIIAGAPLAAVSQNAPTTTSPANAASDCLASPKGTTPQGQHWYYRLERATKRQCWYLRAEGGKVSQTAQAVPDTPAAEPAMPQPHAVQDARAEYLTPQGAAAPKTTAQAVPAPTQQAANPTADSSAQQSAVATRWADASPATTASPTPQAAPAPVAAVAQPSAKPSKSPVALAAADSSTDKPTGSLQMLLLVIGGALALAGILASIVYRFAGGRVRVHADHRRANWDHFEPHADLRAPWLNATAAEVPRAQQPRPVDFDAARPQAPKPQVARPQAAQLAAFSNEIGKIAAQAHPAPNDIADELDEADIFNGVFEIEASSPRLAVNGSNDEEPADRDDDMQHEDAVDVDVITAMLERLAQEGPRLKQPSPEADLADFARTPRGQSAARA